ncbi:MAG: hypothetical protein K8F91_18940 [Candidatus Obscuribacterales bacterium]|nr:hypothetical protein [Candidatus Obscuribacterales bacterium]
MSQATCEPVTMSEQEIKDLVARHVKTRLDMSYDDFIEALANNTLDDPGLVTDLVMLLDLVADESTCAA